MPKGKIYDKVLKNKRTSEYYCYFILGNTTYSDIKEEYVKIHQKYSITSKKNRNIKMVYSLSGKDKVNKSLENEGYLIRIGSKNYYCVQIRIIQDILEALYLKLENNFRFADDEKNKTFVYHKNFIKLHRTFIKKFTILERDLKLNLSENTNNSDNMAEESILTKNQEILFNAFKNYIRGILEYTPSMERKEKFPTYYELINGFIDGFYLFKYGELLELEYLEGYRPSNLPFIYNNQTEKEDKFINNFADLCILADYFTKCAEEKLLSRVKIRENWTIGYE